MNLSVRYSRPGSTNSTIAREHIEPLPRKMPSCAYDSLGREGIKSFLCKDFIAVVSSYIEGKEKELQIRVPDDYKNFLSRMYSEAIAGTLINLFTDEQNAVETTAADEKTIEYLTTALDAAVPASLLGL